jgi:hypothetical protein
LLGTSDAIRKELRYELQPAERALRDDILPKIRGAIGEGALEEARSTGADLDVEEALALVVVSDDA